MSTNGSVAVEVRYVVTDAGREALEHGEACECTMRLVGILLMCAECGTVYGSLKEAKMPGFSRVRRR